MSESVNPLPEALREAYGGDSLAADVVNYIGLAGLVASFFSIIFAYSRQLFALSRAGYLPRVLSTTGKRHTPWVALIVPGTIGFLLAALVSAAVGPDLAGARMIQIAVFGATVSYILMTLSHIVLRRREPELERPYRTPGGVATTGVAFVLACAALVAVFLVDVTAALITLGVFVAFLAYFWFYSRHHLVGIAPEEEFEAITKAESELK
jgi:ethanolamine permease